MNKDNNVIEMLNFKGSGKMTVVLVAGVVMELFRPELNIGAYLIGISSFLLVVSYAVDIFKKMKEIKRKDQNYENNTGVK